MKGNVFVRILQEAKQTGTACAAINVLNYTTARAVICAAQRAKRPVILQPSSGTVRRYGIAETFRMLDGLRRGKETSVAIHLDHCTDVELATGCIDAGWDSVMMDFSARSLEENIALTRQAVDYAHRKGVAVEGEVGVIAGVEDEIAHETANPASYQETLAFLQAARVDAIAPAIGTAHGVYQGRPQLNFQLVEQQETAVVIHGGTGLPPQDFQRLIRLGAAKINISTALKQVYMQSSRQAIEIEGITPIAYDKQVEEACSAAMEQYIRLFAGEEVVL